MRNGQKPDGVEKAPSVPQERRRKGGRPVGSKNSPDCLTSQLTVQRSLNKREARNRLVELVTAKLERIVNAHLVKAEGLSVFMAKDEDGSYTRVKDPAIIETIMNCGPMGDTWRIQVVDPDVNAAKYLLDQALDKAIDRTEVTGADGSPLVIKWKD